tara:strand:+ start:12591 stop:14393 length:1803 start_codon:yes stop_codon:yes gene_type:complete
MFKEENKMSYEKWTSLPQMFFQKANEYSDQPFMWSKIDKTYQPISWKNTADSAYSLAKELSSLGISRGDRIIIVSENRPEWAIADLAIMLAGSISVPAYTTNTIRDHSHIINDSGAKAAIISTREIGQSFLPAAQECKNLKFIISIDDIDDNLFDIKVYKWKNILAAKNNKLESSSILIEKIKRDDVACLIYTSGTGGNPKGVMLTHGSILSNCKGAYQILKQLGVGQEKFLSFLPLSHAYEHTAGLFFPISIGAQIYYAEGIDKLAANLLEVKPTVMISVPRLYDVMRARIMQAIDRQKFLKRFLFKKAVQFGEAKYKSSKKLGLFHIFANQILEILVRKKVQARFGGQLKAMISGGAPLNPDVGLFFTALGVRLLQGYGQTEASPVISCNQPKSMDLETVGPPLVDVNVEIAEDGEILVSGPLIMKGYWNNPESTSLAIRNGWLHTGDVGHIDSHGRIKITDRKKDIIVLSGGETISPQRIEGILTLRPEIGQAMVVGDKKTHLLAILVPDEDFITNWNTANQTNQSLEELSRIPEFSSAISNALKEANKDLSNIEKIRSHILAKEPFTVDNELMTPTLKIRRHKVFEIYRKTLEEIS